MKRSVINKKSLGLVLLLGIGLAGLQAQKTVSTAGGNTIGTQGSVNYTIGQTFYTTTTKADGSVNQGVQQPFEILITSVILGANETKSIELNCTAHPNPVADNLLLTLADLNELSLDNFYYQLIDMSGQMLVAKQITHSETTVPMNGLASGNYFLRVYCINKSEENAIEENRKEMKTFKIIKKKN